MDTPLLTPRDVLFLFMCKSCKMACQGLAYLAPNAHLIQMDTPLLTPRDVLTIVSTALICGALVYIARGVDALPARNDRNCETLRVILAARPANVR